MFFFGDAYSMADFGRKGIRTIEAGKGKILVDGDVLSYAKGKTLMMDLTAEKGPCTDDYCKLIMNLSLKVINDPPHKNLKLFDMEDCVIAMTDAVYRSIDRGRERVTISRTLSGNLIVKGFSLTT